MERLKSVIKFGDRLGMYIKKKRGQVLPSSFEYIKAVTFDDRFYSLHGSGIRVLNSLLKKLPPKPQFNIVCQGQGRTKITPIFSTATQYSSSCDNFTLTLCGQTIFSGALDFGKP